MNNAETFSSAEPPAETPTDGTSWAISTAPASSRSKRELIVRGHALRTRVHGRSRPGAGPLRRRDRLQPGPRDTPGAFVAKAVRSTRSAPLDVPVIGADDILIVDRHLIRRLLKSNRPIISRFDNTATAINNVGDWIDSRR